MIALSFDKKRGAPTTRRYIYKKPYFYFPGLTFLVAREKRQEAGFALS